MFWKNYFFSLLRLTSPTNPLQYSPYAAWSSRRTKVFSILSVCGVHLHTLSVQCSSLIPPQSVCQSRHTLHWTHGTLLSASVAIVAGKNWLFHRCISWTPDWPLCGWSGLSNVSETNFQQFTTSACAYSIVHTSVCTDNFATQ